MRLSELLKPQNIKLGLAARTKIEAITELVTLLVSNGQIVDPEKVLATVLEREATRTTGIGNGVAIPHGKCAGLTDLAIALGKCTTPVDFQAIDGRPVTWIWLLTSPPDKPNPHIHALARISKLMTMEKVRRDLLAAQTPEQVFEVIQQAETTMG
ncbi:MAG: PTS sugar transporter subunit IIA [Tepidisphaeraceae bacterium]|jgi:mannitol/fructose-specific phosphotransferase system IIA component (Ntr-type)